MINFTRKLSERKKAILNNEKPQNYFIKQKTLKSSRIRTSRNGVVLGDGVSLGDRLGGSRPVSRRSNLPYSDGGMSWVEGLGVLDVLDDSGGLLALSDGLLGLGDLDGLSVDSLKSLDALDGGGVVGWWWRWWYLITVFGTTTLLLAVAIAVAIAVASCSGLDGLCLGDGGGHSLADFGEGLCLSDLVDRGIGDGLGRDGVFTPFRLRLVFRGGLVVVNDGLGVPCIDGNLLDLLLVDSGDVCGNWVNVVFTAVLRRADLRGVGGALLVIVGVIGVVDIGFASRGNTEESGRSED